MSIFIIDFDPFWAPFWAPLGTHLGLQIGPESDQKIIKIKLCQHTPQRPFQEAPRPPREAPSTPPEALRSPQEAPRPSQEAPRSPQDGPRPSQKATRSPQEAPKTPEQPQECTQRRGPERSHLSSQESVAQVFPITFDSWCNYVFEHFGSS